MLHELGDTRGAQHHFRAAAGLHPSLVEAHSAYLFALSHDPGISAQDAFREHVRIGDLLEAPYRAAWREHGNDRDPERALRVGFTSGRLHDHPLANLIDPLWRGMQARRNRIYAHANGTWRDAVEARLKTLAHEWLHVERRSDDVLAERIREDRIDILFDLSGHTALNRLHVFARKPAPVQVACLGYAGTTGPSAMDYRLLRGPETRCVEQQPLTLERLVLFGSRTVTGLAAGEFAAGPAAAPPDFRQFQPTKQAGPGRDCAMEPGAAGRAGLASADCRCGRAGREETFRRRLCCPRNRGRPAGLPPSRPPMREYLQRHQHVDVALDTFPYTGGTTTMFAFWMGVPVLTLAGASVQQNQAASFLFSLDLADRVTRSEEEFVERACRAAADLAELEQLRSRLRATAERKFLGSNDDAALAFDAALRAMWRRWCAGQPPEGFTVPA